MHSVTNLIKNWIGTRIDTDGVPKGNPYQCVDPIKKYGHDEFGVPYGAYGDAINYWNHPAGAILAKFDRIATTDIQEGDIVIVKPNHIGIATGVQTSTTFQMIAQNGGNGRGDGIGDNAIRIQTIRKSSIAGVLRPKASAPTPAPAPAPSAGNMPPVGSKVKILPGNDRTTYHAGTTNVAGKIHSVNDNFVYIVRGYDPKFPGRIIINTASGGGNGVALALYFTNGQIIPGWVRI